MIGPVAPRAGDPRRQRARRDPLRQRHRRSPSGARSCAPFLDQYLKDGAPKADIAPVTAFETGTNKWRRLPAWPAGCASGCTVKPTPLYLGAGRRLGFDGAEGRRGGVRPSTSPTRRSPCPTVRRPVRPRATTTERRGGAGSSSDQRDASGRPDVLDVRVGRADGAGEDQRASRSRTSSPRRAAPTPTGS